MAAVAPAFSPHPRTAERVGGAFVLATPATLAMATTRPTNVDTSETILQESSDVSPTAVVRGDTTYSQKQVTVRPPSNKSETSSPEAKREGDNAGGEAPNKVESPSSKKGRGPLSALAALTVEDAKHFGNEDETYDLLEVLGEGSYGSVYKCKRTRNEEIFAVKIIDTHRIGFVGGDIGIRAAQIMAAREVDALRQLSSHRNVISLQDAYFSEVTQQIFIVTDFVPGSHLFSHVVQRTHPLKEAEASHIVAQISDAMSFCHSLGIVHRDLKLENVLVSSVSMRLIDREKDNGVVVWESEEIFTIRICDFGFAKSLHAFTTRTPIGTGTYAAPEVKVDSGDYSSVVDIDQVENKHYDAFKADAYSLGVMIFVMLCLGFPKRKGSHRSHKGWKSLSEMAQQLIDRLLEVDPYSRCTISDVVDDPWVQFILSEDGDEVGSRELVARAASKENILSSAEAGWKVRSPQPRWDLEAKPQDKVLPAILGLHRALVHLQQERAMACWALSGAAGLGGISCWDQLQWHMQLTDKRLLDGKGLVDPELARSANDPLVALRTPLTRARRVAQARQLREKGGPTRSAAFDQVFLLYSEACAGLIEFISHALNQSLPPGFGRSAERRYRLFSAAAEQLGRERAFMCGHENPDDEDEATSPRGSASQKLTRLAEILGARKILLGTSVADTQTSSDIVATSDGLVGALMGEDQPALLSPEDLAKLESLEQRVMGAHASDMVPTEEWYQTLTRFLNDIHSRIAIALVDEFRQRHDLPGGGRGRLNSAGASLILDGGSSPSRRSNTVQSFFKAETTAELLGSDLTTCGACRRGLKALLLEAAKRL